MHIQRDKYVMPSFFEVQNTSEKKANEDHQIFVNT